MSDTPDPLLEKNLFEAFGAARFGAPTGEWPRKAVVVDV